MKPVYNIRLREHCGNTAERRDTVAETQQQTCVFDDGIMTITRVSVDADTAKPDHFYSYYYF